MSMYKPPYLGEFIREVYLERLSISYRAVASKLHVAPSTFNLLVQGQNNISYEIALRLSKTLGKLYNLWQVKQHFNLDEVEKLAMIRSIKLK